MNTKFIPGDFVNFNDKVHYVVVRSIQDGVSLLLASLDKYGVSTIVVNPENIELTLAKPEDISNEDKQRLITEDYILQAMYF